MSVSKKPKIALAVQGSFGHIDYAAGVLDAFRAYNHAAHAAGTPTLEIIAGSSCVEMVTPLWLYLLNQNSDISMRDIILHGDETLSPLAQQRIAPPGVRPDVWKSFFSGLLDAQKNLAEASLELVTSSVGAGAAMPPKTSYAMQHPGVAATSKMMASMQDVFMYGSGLPGQIAFNPFFKAEKTVNLEIMCAKEDGPTLFTNATRANDFREVYLYTGTAPNETQSAKMLGNPSHRHVLRLTPEYFFASGARPPYIAPMPVTVDGQTEHWMEGAMRCNPPLTPLIDMDATHIVLLRFFSKDAHEVPNNNTELNERFLDAIFNIPLQKEVESIKRNNEYISCINKVVKKEAIPKNLRHRREIVVLDPADRDNAAASPGYIKFLNEELNSLSHFDAGIPMRRAEMFDRGFQIGKLLIEDLQKHLPN